MHFARASFIPLILLSACSEKEPDKKPVDTTLPSVNSPSDTPTDQVQADASGTPVADPSVEEPNAATANLTDYNFSDFPSESYAGQWVLPDFSGAQRRFRTFRTKILDGARQGPVFAGSVAITQFGCGTECTWGFAVDLKNGNVVPLPVGGEAMSDLETEYHPQSRLLKATWKGALKEYPGDRTVCVGFAYFEWTGSEFRSLKQSTHSPSCE